MQRVEKKKHDVDEEKSTRERERDDAAF